MNPYSVLGVKPSDSNRVIKKAYRKLANKHHPDKGGDATKFKEIRTAWESILSGKASKNTYKSHKTNKRTYRGKYKKKPNKYITVNVNVTLFQAVNGGKYVLHLDTGITKRDIEIDIPPGIHDNDVVNYHAVITDKIDARVRYTIIKSEGWELRGLDIIKDETFTFWELLFGTERIISTITNGRLKLVLPASTSPGTLIKFNSHGTHSRENYSMRGNMYVRINASLPKGIPPGLLLHIKQHFAK